MVALGLLLSTSLAGCVWAPDPTVIPEVNYQPASFSIHIVSERSVAGTERVTTVVEPYLNNNNYLYEGYNDSVEYIIVNGDTAYRHPVPTQPPVFDSSAMYHVDGTLNYVTMVFPSFTTTDTTYESDFMDSITAPRFGTTIHRDSDAYFSYEINSGYDYASMQLQITDSIEHFDESLDEGSGSIDVPMNEMQLFQPGTLWVELHFSETEPLDHTEYSIDRQITLDRIVAYPLQ